MTVTLSARYHDFLKDRLYTFRSDSPQRRSAQTVIYHHLRTLDRLLAPILVFTSDEAYLAGGEREKSSIHLEDWPVVPESWRNPEVASEVEQLLELRDPVNEKLETLRARKEIGKSVEAALTFSLNEENSLFGLLQKYGQLLAEIYIVSTVQVSSDANADDLQIEVSTAAGDRCPRCWRTVPECQPTALGDVCPRCADAVQPFVNLS